MSADAPFDFWWERNSIEADTPDDAAEEFVENLRTQMESGELHLVYRQPDVDDTDHEMTVEISHPQRLFLELFQAVAACEAPEESQVDEALDRFQAAYDRIQFGRQ